MVPFSFCLGGIGRFFARPASGRPCEAFARTVVEEALDHAEQRALDHESYRQLRQADLPVLGPRRVLVLEAAPDEVEDFLRELPGRKTADDADRQEQELHFASFNFLVSRGSRNGSLSSG